MGEKARGPNGLRAPLGAHWGASASLRRSTDRSASFVAARLAGRLVGAQRR
jgi:hypothetical protein